MTFSINAIDGTPIDLNEYGLRPLKLEIDSLSPRGETEVIDGRDGFIDIDTTYDGRSMRASFLLFAIDLGDFNNLRNQVFKLFDGKTYFYLTDTLLPNRRWKVKSVSKYTPRKVNPSTGTIDVELISSSSYAESIFSTLIPDSQDGYFQVSAQGPVQYVFDQPSFSVWNEGDINVDPRDSYLKIIFTGASTNLTITNLTTGDEWNYTGTTAAGDTITLDGIRFLKNGQSILGQTNKKLITLTPGWNEFVISGTSGVFEINFDFRFLFI